MNTATDTKRKVVRRSLPGSRATRMEGFLRAVQANLTAAASPVPLSDLAAQFGVDQGVLGDIQRMGIVKQVERGQWSWIAENDAGHMMAQSVLERAQQRRKERLTVVPKQQPTLGLEILTPQVQVQQLSLAERLERIEARLDAMTTMLRSHMGVQ